MLLFDSDNLVRFTKMVLNLSTFAVFLKNRNIISKIRRSKVTDNAALIESQFLKKITSSIFQREHSVILSTFIKLLYHLPLRSLFCLFLNGRFTEVLLYFLSNSTVNPYRK